MDLLKVQSLSDAKKTCVTCMNELSFKREIEIATEDALGYILAEDVISNENIPAFRRSTMDGFAVVSTSTNGASETIPTVLNIIETIEIGDVPEKVVDANTASQIFTGGMLPEGADAIVPIEYADKLSDTLLAIYTPVKHLEYVVDIGDDCKEGDLYYETGTRVTPEVVAGCISLGKTKVNVYDKLTARILSTGDEILPPDAEIPLGKTRDINSYSIEALCKELGINVIDKKHVNDEKEAIKKELLAEDVDMVIVSGSSSKGNKDFVPTLVEELFNPGLLIHGIGIKPGKPTSLSTDGKKMVLGLPGHPVSAMAVFKTFFASAWKAFYGEKEEMLYPCKVTRNMAATPGRTKVQFVHASREGEDLVAEPIFGASGNISTLAKSNGYFIIEDNEEGVEKGDTVWVSLL